MTFGFYERFSLYLTLALSLSIIGITEEISPALLGIVLAALGLRIGSEVRGSQPLLRATVVPAILLLGYGLLNIFVLAPNILVAVVDLVMLLVAIRLIGERRVRDNLQLIGLSFLLILGATVMTVNTMFGLLFLGYMFAGLWALLMQNLRAQWESTGQEARLLLRKRRILGRPFAGAVFALGFGILVFTLAFYFLFPRVGIRWWNAPVMQPQPISGFSDTVNLHDIGRIQANPQVALRVDYVDHLPPRESPHRRLRGVVLDSFDGTTWRDSRSAETSSLSHVHSYKWRLAEGSEDDHVIIHPERSYIDTIFTPTGAISIEGDFRSVTRTDTGNIAIERRPGGSHRYRIGLGTPVDRSPPSDLHLAIPDDLQELILATAEEWAPEDLSGRQLATHYEQRFQDGFTYSLEVPSSDMPPVASFLTEHQQGHCELFAASMALLLRARGIPTRMVNGFAGGEDWDGYTVVFRELHAHSWVEAYLPGQGWVEFDPTPAWELSMSRFDQMRLGILRSMDRARFWWAAWFIDYDFRRQAALASDFREASNRLGNQLNPSAFREWMQSRREEAANWVPWFVLFLGIGGTAGLVIYLRRKKLGQLAEPELRRLYRKRLQMLEHQHPRKAGQPPLAYAHEIAHINERYRPFVPYTVLYYRLRYGPKASAEEGLRFLELHAELPRALRKSISD